MLTFREKKTMTLATIINKHTILKSINTTDKSFQEWIDADVCITDHAKETSKHKKDIVFAIAAQLKRDGERYLNCYKASVSRAKKVLGKETTAGKVTTPFERIMSMIENNPLTETEKEMLITVLS